jgi:hypothetical protein
MNTLIEIKSLKSDIKKTLDSNIDIKEKVESVNKIHDKIDKLLDFKTEDYWLSHYADNYGGNTQYFKNNYIWIMSLYQYNKLPKNIKKYLCEPNACFFTLNYKINKDNEPIHDYIISDEPIYNSLNWTGICNTSEIIGTKMYDNKVYKGVAFVYLKFPKFIEDRIYTPIPDLKTLFEKENIFMNILIEKRNGNPAIDFNGIQNYDNTVWWTRIRILRYD